MKFRFPVICAVLLCLAANAAGQEYTRDFQFVVDTNPYLSLNNPAAVSFFNGKIATAAVSFEKANGGLMDINESPDSWAVVAGTESYLRVSDLISFHGKVAWSDFAGKDMGGPILMDPDYNPVGFYELNETTLGRKQRELYNLCGDIALNLGDKWGLGLGVSYEAGDQTKVKDPRFSNIWMDLSVNAGLSFAAADWLTLGVSAQWRNTLENIKGHIYGTTDKQYYICTDKGGFFGTVASLEGDYNYIPDSTPRPMNNDWYGGAFQVVLFGGKFSNEFSYMLRDGYYGKKASSSPTFFEFKGTKMGYEGLLLIPFGRNIFRTAASFSQEKLANNENQFQYNTPEGGSAVVDYTGQSQVGNRRIRDAKLDIRWMTGVEGDRAATTIGLRGGWNSMRQTTTVYPFWRVHIIQQVNAGLFCQKNFFFGSNILTVDASGTYIFGRGTKKNDGTYVDGATSSSLRSFDTYLDKHFEAETAPRAGGSLGLTYTRVMRHISPWIKLSDSYTSLLAAPEFLSGRTRNIAEISIGCTF